MSFITKRERIFNEYDLFDLPARNEGKLKAFASCTDARAWSHFCSNKSEHLVEIIKRNNDTCRRKYVPTDVIVDTLMVAKNAEITRLKQKIEEFEQMLAAYDELDLTTEQKCEIANAHTCIKAANKELNELCLDLDLSGFTEGVDSETFETGKSRGDEPSRYRADEWIFERDPAPKMETKCNQANISCSCDASTSATDPRNEEMQDDIIFKDAKLSAMQNTIAVMENDLCEPYCIYAHIYTALEKIFGILRQNEKYKQYLDLLTTGMDTRLIDVKGKILFKLMVYEKFCLALIAPCSRDFDEHSIQDCSCCNTEIVARVETTYALTSSESRSPNLDTKRAHLVADIIQNEEMKEMLNKDEIQTQDDFSIGNYSIDGENLKRLKNLQENYDDLMNCYETLKYEKDYLQIKCHKYEDFEIELDNLRYQLREYNNLWTEKEHYKMRSNDLDALKEQCLLLSNETNNLETRLRSEAEINNIKSKTLEELRKENILLEKKLNEASIVFEKEKNTLLCRLKETECKVMCEEQQIKSLSLQIDRLLEQIHEKDPNTHEMNAITLLDQIESNKEQIKNLKDALICNEEEKQNLQDDFHDKLKLINDFKMEIEDWKSTCDKTLQRNEYLEKYADDIREELITLSNKNQILSQEVEEKTIAVENLMNVINNKSQEVDRLMSEINSKNIQHENLFKMYQALKHKQDICIGALEDEKTEAISSLQIARHESQELLQRMKSYEDMVQKNDDMCKTLDSQVDQYDKLKNLLYKTIKENNYLQANLTTQEKENLTLIQELKELRELNNNTINTVNKLQDERNDYKMTYELTKKESMELENKLHNFENLRQELDYLRESHEKLIYDKHSLENELHDNTTKLASAIHSFELSEKESSEIINKMQEEYEHAKEDIAKNKTININLSKEKLIESQHFSNERIKVKILEQELKISQKENKRLLEITQNISILEKELIDIKAAYDKLLTEKKKLQNDFNAKAEEINSLYNTSEDKIEENIELTQKIQQLKYQNEKAINNINDLETENFNTQKTLNEAKKESAYLIDKIKQYEFLETECDDLKKAHAQMKVEKEILEKEIIKQSENFDKIEKENHELHNHSQTLLLHSKDLENALINARSENSIQSHSVIHIQYVGVLNEIEEMKKEKLISQNKIRDLLNKLEEMENTISDLSEQILARNDKIAILENHINELEVEVRQLHNCLDEIVNAGEQIKDNSYEKINQSIKKIEAHHSKAAHNMKMELVQLHDENAKLENQLSFTKLKTEEALKQRYVSQIINLQNEREIIVTDIKQLELSSVGDSVLSPDKCEVDDILNSLERIQKHLDTKSSRSNFLEQTLLQVQTSSQLLLSKAEEAKKIVEKEKQKIVNEKEDIMRDRHNIEKQLVDLRETLEKQIACDKGIIRDLEAEVLNKDLIIDKINKSTQSYISKLEEEIQNMKDLYESSLKKLETCHVKIQIMSEEKSKNEDILNKVNTELKENSKEIENLQKCLEKLKNIPKCNFGIQSQITTELLKSIGIQTEKSLKYERLENSNLIDKNNIINEKNNSVQSKSNLELHKIRPNFVNEVQVLNAQIEPTFAGVKNIYLSYKTKRLERCGIEQCSVTCITDDINENNLKTLINHSTQVSQQSIESQQTDSACINSVAENYNLINIYNRRSMNTNSSKVIDNDDQDTIFTINPTADTSTKLSAFAELGSTNESFDTKENNEKNDQDNVDNFFNSSVSENSIDKDVFVIYHDSESNATPNAQDYERLWSSKEKSEILDEAFTIYSNDFNENELKLKKENKKDYVNYENSFLSIEGECHDNNAKNKLDVNLPRVETESKSVIILDEKKSLDSYTIPISPSPNKISTSGSYLKLNRNSNDEKSRHKTSVPNILNDKFNLNSNNISYKSMDKNNSTRITIEERSSKNHGEKIKSLHSKNTVEIYIPQKNSTSHHNLSRVDADTLLIKNKESHKAVKEYKNDSYKESNENFGMKYILDTIEGEMQPEYSKTYGDSCQVRKTQSVNKMVKNISTYATQLSQSELKTNKISLPEGKSNTSPNRTKLNFSNSQKSFLEQSVMVKVETGNDHERKIQYLTNLLENTEKDYKKKIEAIKMQYDNNIKCIINDHNKGVNTIQGIHEETFQDIIKVHENEVENLRSMSIEAMRKAEKLEKENRSLKTKILNGNPNYLDKEPMRHSTPETKKRRKCRETKNLTKTDIEAFNVKPKTRSHGPCTCSLETNVSDTIRKIFEQVDAEQRRLAENTYINYIANKIINDNVEALDTKELSYLHLKVCRIWKTKMGKQETLQKTINSLECELMHKQLHAQQHMADLDREVTEERQRLQELREAVCRKPLRSQVDDPELDLHSVPLVPSNTVDIDFKTCMNNPCVNDQRSAGDLIVDLSKTVIPPRRLRMESNRAVLAKMDVEERREKKLYNDEPPTRLRKSHDRQTLRSHKK